MGSGLNTIHFFFKRVAYYDASFKADFHFLRNEAFDATPISQTYFSQHDFLCPHDNDVKQWHTKSDSGHLRRLI